MSEENRESVPSRRNVGQVERVASIAVGSVLAYRAWVTRSPAGAGLGALGLALAGRGVTGRCPVYRATGVDTSQRKLALPSLRRGNGGVVILQVITVNRPCQKVYERWRAFDKLPDILRHVESVSQSEDGRRSHWVVRGPLGARIEWDAEIIEDVPGERIAWRSVEGSPIENEGEVRVAPAPAARGTELSVRIVYRPPAGAVLAPVLAKLTNVELHEDLRCFKRFVETGEIPTTEGQPHGPVHGLATQAMKKVRGAARPSAQRSAS